MLRKKNSKSKETPHQKYNNKKKQKLKIKN
jgi:hypothetical protein